MVSLLPRKSSAPEPDPDELRALRADVQSLRAAQIESGLAEQRARVDALKRAEAAREAADRTTRVGPCIYCGLSRSRTGSLGWQGSNPKRLACPWCVDDRWDHTDLEHKSIVLNRIITGDWKARHYPYGRMAELLIQRTGFRWFHESPGATPGEWNSWAYLDLAAIRQRATPTTPEPPPLFRRGDPCPKCGCAFMWTNMSGTTWVTSPEGGAGRDIVTGINSHVGCGGCVEIRDLNDVMKKIVGVHGSLRRWPDFVTPNTVGQEVASYELLGVTWFADRPVRSGEHTRSLTLVPFAYLNLPDIRRRAFEHFPFQSQWTNQAAWAQLFAEATNSPTTGG